VEVGHGTEKERIVENELGPVHWIVENQLVGDWEAERIRVGAVCVEVPRLNQGIDGIKGLPRSIVPATLLPSKDVEVNLILPADCAIVLLKPT